MKISDHLYTYDAISNGESTFEISQEVAISGMVIKRTVPVPVCKNQTLVTSLWSVLCDKHETKHSHPTFCYSDSSDKLFEKHSLVDYFIFQSADQYWHLALSVLLVRLEQKID